MIRLRKCLLRKEDAHLFVIFQNSFAFYFSTNKNGKMFTANKMKQDLQQTLTLTRLKYKKIYNTNAKSISNAL